MNKMIPTDHPQIFRLVLLLLFACLFVCFLFVCFLFFYLRATKQWRSQYGERGQSAALQRTKCLEEGEKIRKKRKNREKEEKLGRKGEIGKVLSHCPS